MTRPSPIFDIFIIGGGINGCGIARDAAGRGYSVGLCEAGDLGAETSSASSKLIHGGLRYLEHYEFGLVRKALKEREVLWRMAPHIIEPLRFVLPHHNKMRPQNLLRMGLWIYDFMGGRDRLPPSKKVALSAGELKGVLKKEFLTGLEYSDCRAQDSRLVVLNALDAKERGAKIFPRTRLLDAREKDGLWHLTLQPSKGAPSETPETVRAAIAVNATGPYADEILKSAFGQGRASHIRLIRGSHIIVPRKFSHDRAYIFQNEDGRVLFAIPYEEKYTLIGTTDAEHESASIKPMASEAEIDYLCRMASVYFAEPVLKKDIIGTFSGVRPIYDDGASKAQEATRNYVIKRQGNLVNVFGGKLTTYRLLAERVLRDIEAIIAERGDMAKKGASWSKDAPLPGGDFPRTEIFDQIQSLKDEFPFLADSHARRLTRAYGTRARKILKNCKAIEDLGQKFADNLYEKEVLYLMEHEWAASAEDILFRRTKLGLEANAEHIASLQNFLDSVRVLSPKIPNSGE